MTKLEAVDEGLWQVEHDHYMYGFVHFRGRMTVVRLDEGGLLLHSVIPIDDPLAAELAALGEVKVIVAPNRVHHMYLPQAIERYPHAKVWAAPGLATKRRDLTFDATLGETDPPWANQFEPLVLQGNDALSEVVFLHRASKTAVVTDLVFNIHEVGNVWTRMILRMAGAWRTFAQSKLWRTTTRDRDAMRRSIEALLAWDFERVVMAHGEIVHKDGHQRLKTALWWMRGLPALPAASQQAYAD